MRTLSLRNVSIEILLFMRHYWWQQIKFFDFYFGIYDDFLILAGLEKDIFQNKIYPNKHK